MDLDTSAPLSLDPADTSSPAPSPTKELTFGPPVQLSRPPAAPSADAPQLPSDIKFGEPVQLTPRSPGASGSAEIQFGEPVRIRPSAPEIQFGEPRKALTFGTPVDVFAEASDPALFEAWKAAQPSTPITDKVASAAGNLLTGAGHLIATSVRNSLSVLRGIADPTLSSDEKYAKLTDPAKELGASATEVAADAFKGSALLGDAVVSGLSKLQAANPTFEDQTPDQKEFFRIAAVKAERKFYRDARELQKSDNDGRVVADALFTKYAGTQTNNLTAVPVDKEAAEFVANFASDPALVGNVASAVAKKAFVEFAAKKAITSAPFVGDIAAATRDVAAALAKKTESEANVLVAKSAGADATALETAASKDVSAFEEANQRFARSQQALKDQQAALDALEAQNGKSLGQRATGRAIEGAGAASVSLGELIERLTGKANTALDSLAEGDVTGRRLLLKGAQKIVPSFLKDAVTTGKDALLSGGEIAKQVGRLIADKENSLPYFTNLARALPKDSAGRWAAGQLERVEFLSTAGRWAFDSAGSAAHGGAIGAAFGVLNGDPIGGATQGALLGMAGSQFSQFAHFNSPEQVHMQQMVDIAQARQRAALRGDEHAAAFDALPAGSKLLISQVQNSHPDLAVTLDGENGVSSYIFDGATGTISLDHANPIAGALSHEVKHHLMRNPEIAQVVYTKLLGDADLGVPGLFTRLDADGRPIVTERPTSVPGVTVKAFQLNDEFQNFKTEYLDRLRAKNLPTVGYENSDALIAQEVFSEAQAGNLLHRQANGSFDIAAAQKMGTVRRAIADAIDGSDLVANSAFLQRSLAKFGIVFNGLDGKAANTGLFSQSVRVPGMPRLLEKYYEGNDRERAVSGDPENLGEKIYTEAEITKSPQLSKIFDSGFDTAKDASGKVTFVSPAEAKAKAKDFSETLRKELDQSISTSPDQVRKVETIDAAGKKTTSYRGKTIPESVLTTMESSGRFNAAQLENLRTLSQILTAGDGTEVNFAYQPASKRGGRLYRTRAITSRTETPINLEITKDGNVIIKTVSQEKVLRNAVAYWNSGKANLWPSFDQLQADLKTYIENHAKGLAGDANGIGTARRDQLNAFFGQSTNEQRNANPRLQEFSAKEARNLGVIQSRRLDRINSIIPLDTTFKPDYGKVSKNYSPSTALEHSLGDGELKFTHFSGAHGLRELDPKFFARSGITPRSEQSGLPRVYGYAEGSKFGADKGLIDVRRAKYQGTVSRGKLYDGVHDPLNIGSVVNREVRDLKLKDRGYLGIYNEDSSGRKQVELFGKTKVKPVESGKQFSPGKKGYSATEFWLGPDGLDAAKDGHESWVVSRFGKDGSLEHSRGREENINQRFSNYGVAEEKGFLRVSRFKDELHVDGSDYYPSWNSMPRSYRTSLQDYAFDKNVAVMFDGIEVFRPEAPGKQFSPGSRETVSPHGIVDDDSGPGKTAFFGDGSHLTFREGKKSVSITGIFRDPADTQLSGQRMVQWARDNFREKKLVAVDVAFDAIGFWDKMEERGVVDNWKQGRQFSPGNYEPVIVGDVGPDGVRMKKGKDLDHERLGLDAGFNGEGHGWRYNPRLKELFWWNEKPNAQTQDLVAGHLESKGYEVTKQTVIDGQNAATDRAHGFLSAGAAKPTAESDAEFFRQFPQGVIRRDGKVIRAPEGKQFSPGSEEVPDTLYHGSPHTFSEFQKGRAGLVFLSDSPDYSKRYGKNLMEVSTTAKKFADLDHDVGLRQKVIEAFNESNFRNTDDGFSPVFEPKNDDTWELLESPGAVQLLTKLGFEGAKFHESSLDGKAGGTTYALFDPSKVKTKGQQSPGILRPSLHDSDTLYSPGTGNPETRKIAEEYARKAGLDFIPHNNYDELPETKIRAIADHFENEAKHDPENPEVKKSYAALVKETKAQYQSMVDAGIKIEPFTGSGEPYKSSLDMMKDVRDNKHLAFFLTDAGFGDGSAAKDNPLLAPSGIKIGDRELLNNDLFRAVHDFFGHTQGGFQFGPRGEFNAYREHSRMFSNEAQGALAAETLAQNAYVNFGSHLRGLDGEIPKKGEPGYVAPQDRPFAEQKNFVVPEELRQFSPGSELEKADEPLRISTRVPTAKKATEDSLAAQLNISARDVLPDADARREVAAILKKYPNVPAGLKKPDEVLKAFHDHVVSNLLYLHDSFDPNLRERSKLWYDGARKITEKWSKSYDMPREGVAGVLASLSPQKDWFMNLDLARRVIEHNQALKKRNLSDGIVDWFRGKFGDKKPLLLAALESKVGTPFTELSLIERAVTLRAFDELGHDRGYQIVTPEGDSSGPAKKLDGGAAKVAWGDFNTIAKAISISDHPSRENISRQLGEEHKVRNFYNNILLPHQAEHGDVTIDTHAVAAALLRPLAGSDSEVAQNFGSGAPGSAITGASGLYGLYADAYRDAAKQRGRLPREMQSITWEAVRGLFTPEFKTAANKAAVDSLWKQYKDGTLTLDDARKQIHSLAGGITAPSWAGSHR